MTHTPGTDSFNHAAAQEPRLLLKLLHAINGSPDRQRLVAACLDVVARPLPFEFAFCLLKRTAPPGWVIAEAHRVPPAFEQAFEHSSFAYSFEPSIPEGLSLQALNSALRDASPEDLTPLPVPLTARGQVIGVLVLMLRRAYAQSAAHYADLLDVLGKEMGIALERLEALAGLCATEQWHRAFMENSPEGFWETDENSVIRFANAATLRILGLPENQVLGKQLSDLSFPDPRLSPEDWEQFRNLFDKLNRFGSVADYEYRLATNEGTKTISLTAHTARDAAGKVQSIQGILRDVSAQALARQKLEKRTRELQLLHEMATSLNKAIDMPKALGAALDPILTMTGAEAIGIALIDHEGGHYDLVAQRGLEPELVQYYASAPFDRAIFKSGFDPDTTWNLIEYLVLTGRILNTADFEAMPRFDLQPLRALGYQSFLAFPMRFDNYVYGVVMVGSKQPDKFDAHVVRLGDSISAQLGLALHNQRQVQDLQTEVKQATAIMQVGQWIQYAPSAEVGLPAVMHTINAALGASYSVLHLLREDHFEIVTASDSRETVQINPIAAYERCLLQTDEPLVVGDREAPDVDPEQREILKRLKMSAAFGVRLIAQKRPLGLLFVNQDQPRVWRESDVKLIRIFAQQIAYALENKRLFDETRMQVRQLEALKQAGNLISKAKPPDSALHAVAAEIARVFPADYVSFQLREEYQLRLVAESYPSGGYPVLPILPHQYQILEELHPVKVTDCTRDSVSPVQREYLQKFNLVADLGVPLVAEHKALGILYISQHTPHAWSESEVRLAEMFAQQIAGVLVNARLLRESQAQVSDLRALARAANLIAMSRSPASALSQVARDLRQVLQADYVAFHLLEGNELCVYTESDNRWAIPRYLPLPHHWMMLRYLQKLVTNDCETDCKSQEHRELLKKLGLCADLGVPMVARGRGVGILFVSMAQPRVWQESEIRLVETFAQHIANVLENVQLLNEQEARVQELEQLAQINELATTIPNEQALIDMALEAGRNLLVADHVSLLLMDENGGSRGYATGGTRVERPTLNPLLKGILEGREVVISDEQRAAPSDDYLRERKAFHKLHSTMAVPLVAGEKSIGLFNFGFHDPHLFTPNEIRLAQAAANQLAMALANSRLVGEQHDRIVKLSLLAEFSQLCGQLRDSARLEQVAVERIQEMLGAKAVSLRQVEGNMLTVGAAVGYSDPGSRNHPIPVSSHVQRFLAQQKPQMTADIHTESDAPSHWVERHVLEGFVSFLMVPMIAESQVTGILTVFNGKVHRWSEAEIQYTQTVANTLALALSNIRQFKTAEHKTDELQATLDSAFSGIFTTDEQGVILSWNRAARGFTGYTFEDMHGKRWETDGPWVGKHRRPDTLLQEAMVDKSVRFSLAPRYFESVDGRTIQLREAAAPLRDGSGNVRGAVCAFWDRTQEQAAERAKIDFINEMGHELGNKLGVVIMSAQQLQRGKLNDRLRERYVRVIADTARDLEVFNKRFKDFQHELVQEPIEQAEVNLHTFINEHIRRYRANTPDRRFRVSGAFDFVLADAQRLAVVLENLLDNAVKYSPPRSTISVRAALPNPDELHLAIRNRGEPISPELRPHLFERWQRGASDKPGTGLGLWLVRTKLHEMGGEIDVTSDTRHGTIFTIKLPRKSHVLPDSAAKSASRKRSDRKGGVQARGAG